MNLSTAVIVSVMEWATKGQRSRAPTDYGFASGGDWREVAHPHQVVGGGSEGKRPTDPLGTSMSGLAQPADGLDPTEDLFDSFALDLTGGIARMASGAAVDSAVHFARYVRSDSIRAQLAHQLFLIVTLVGAQRDPTAARDLCRHRQSRGGLGAAAG